MIARIYPETWVVLRALMCFDSLDAPSNYPGRRGTAAKGFPKIALAPQSPPYLHSFVADGGTSRVFCCVDVLCRVSFLLFLKYRRTSPRTGETGRKGFGLTTPLISRETAGEVRSHSSFSRYLSCKRSPQLYAGSVTSRESN